MAKHTKAPISKDGSHRHDPSVTTEHTAPDGTVWVKVFCSVCGQFCYETTK